jgi:ADP-ribose pyrophosphatase YjhB (NUDIX family)
MLKQIVGKIWQKAPSFVRVKLVRALQKKFTVSVGAVIFNDENKVLLLEHVLRPASGWGIPGGFIEANEQPADALQRELIEEVGLKIKDIEFFRIRTFGHHIEILFSARSNDVGEVKSFEIKALDWFELDNLPAEMSHIQKQIIKDVLSKTVKY